MQMKAAEGWGVAQTLKKNKMTFLSAFATTYLPTYLPILPISKFFLEELKCYLFLSF